MQEGDDSDGDKKQSGAATPRFVTEVTDHDVLFGRGALRNWHVGNITYRRIVKERKAEYHSVMTHREKNKIAQEISDEIFANSGRFLREIRTAAEAKALGIPRKTQAWVIVQQPAINAKVKQALREGEKKTYSAREHGDDDNDDDEEHQGELDDAETTNQHKTHTAASAATRATSMPSFGGGIEQNLPLSTTIELLRQIAAPPDDVNGRLAFPRSEAFMSTLGVSNPFSTTHEHPQYDLSPTLSTYPFMIQDQLNNLQSFLQLQQQLAFLQHQQQTPLQPQNQQFPIQQLVPSSSFALNNQLILQNQVSQIENRLQDTDIWLANTGTRSNLVQPITGMSNDFDLMEFIRRRSLDHQLASDNPDNARMQELNFGLNTDVVARQPSKSDDSDAKDSSQTVAPPAPPEQHATPTQSHQTTSDHCKLHFTRP